MTAFPSLTVVPSTGGLLSQFQTIQNSIRGALFGLAAGSSLSGGMAVVGPNGYPLRPEAGKMIAATTADTIANFGEFSLTATGTTATFTVDNPVPAGRVRIQLNANPSTTIKFVTPSSNITFSTTSGSNSLTISSSLFFSAHELELVGMSTAAYRVSKWFSQTGSTILPSYTT